MRDTYVEDCGVLRRVPFCSGSSSRGIRWPRDAGGVREHPMVGCRAKRPAHVDSDGQSRLRARVLGILARGIVVRVSSRNIGDRPSGPPSKCRNERAVSRFDMPQFALMPQPSRRRAWRSRSMNCGVSSQETARPISPHAIVTRRRASPRTISSSDCRRTPREPAGTPIVFPFRTIVVPCALRSSNSR